MCSPFLAAAGLRRPSFQSGAVMSSDPPEPKQGDGLTSEQLIRSGLDDQARAIAGYEGVIWKIRSGYIVVLYGTLTLILGEEGVPNVCAISHNFSQSVALFSLIFGLSLSVFLIDFGYVRKKLKFVVAREELVELACRLDFDIRDQRVRDKLKKLLHVAGETRPAKLSKEARAEYKEKRKWNLFWILLPVYLTTPVLALSIFILCRMG